MSETLSLQRLRDATVFRELDETALAALAAASFTQILPRGAVLFEEGAMPEAVHLILAGRVGLVASDGTRHETVIEIFGPDSLLVAPAAILGLPYLVSGLVLAEARLTLIKVDAFRATLDREPRLARALVDMLAAHWRLLIGEVKELKLRPGRGRLARWLLRAAAAGDRVELADRKAVLARRLGMTPESLSRAIAALEATGAIRTRGTTIELHDRAALTALAAGG